jgi:hypothetical protein
MGFYHDMSQAMLLLLLKECSESHMGLAGPALGTMWLALNTKLQNKLATTLKK